MLCVQLYFKFQFLVLFIAMCVQLYLRFQFLVYFHYGNYAIVFGISISCFYLFMEFDIEMGYTDYSSSLNSSYHGSIRLCGLYCLTFHGNCASFAWDNYWEIDVIFQLCFFFGIFHFR